VLPHEACGLAVAIDGKWAFRPARNLATEPDRFIIDPGDYADAEDVGRVAAVFHSHADGPARFSAADIRQASATRLPWFLLSVAANRWACHVPPSAAERLAGRGFLHGSVDCYSLVRDTMGLLFGVALPDFPRSDEWWHRGGDLYREHFAEAGWAALPADAELQPGDGLLMRVRAPVPNHAAIYLGDGMMIHHLADRLSTREPYLGYWQQVTVLRLRHRELADA
jgi:cell wall-associated NlpC family hydrolase